jgi:hypothetical protein
MPLEQEQIEMLTVHLPYELDMLNATYRLLASEQAEDATLCNIFFECFFLHARNLLEFFNKHQSRTASASAFTSRRLTYELASLEDAINNQIVHPNYARGENASEPVLNGTHVQRIKGDIDRAVADFQSALTDDAKEHWKPRKSDNTTVSVASFYASATNAIHSVTTICQLRPE